MIGVCRQGAFVSSGGLDPGGLGGGLATPVGIATSIFSCLKKV